ncbi:hypothetical protein LEM8419_00405 [Neolewinella maritima]|uniref:Uncharacterized protein n=1 Tax=Neolewinella maritima TaxID=1383882 RepID=A0ABN8EZ39_9BACT|nr:hypothetical protein [Neolewinella maritima]CAH0999109.1 hypothetical protein LEM8419_00405 [Neolewinella maritima]
MKYVSLLLALFLCTCVPAQTVSDSLWTPQDAARYARNRADSSLWDRELLSLEPSAYRYDSTEVQPALSFWPIPVPAYDYGYGSVRTTVLRVAGRSIFGSTMAYAHGPYRPHPMEDSLAYYQTSCTIYILTDRPDDDSGTFHLVSRNYPHYLTTGKRLTSVGEVDFVQMSLADGANFAIVNQRYFDLAYGRTILAVPLQNGSMRLLQLEDSPESLRAGAEHQEWNQAHIEAFERRLETDPQVIAFFTQVGVLSQ